MQLVIDISSYDKEWITSGYYIPEEINLRISEAIANGKPPDEVDNSVLKHLKDEIQEKGFNSPLMNPVFTMTEILEMIDKHTYELTEEFVDADSN